MPENGGGGGVSVFSFLKWPFTGTKIFLFVGRHLYKSSYGKKVKKTTTFC